MDAIELSKLINSHLSKVATGTKLQGKVAPGKKAMFNGPTSPTVNLQPPVGTGPNEYVEIDDSLFFFYHPATIVRWPKPVAGDLRNFTVRVELVPQGSGPQTKMTHQNVVGSSGQAFQGRFRIESDGTLVTLVINPVPPAPGEDTEPGGPKGIDVVVLGNPGGEVGTNGNC